MILVAIVEDDVEIRDAIHDFLNGSDAFVCELAVNSVEALQDSLTKSDLPEVVLMDIGLPGMSGIDGIRLLKGKFPVIDFMMLTIYHDSQKIFESLRAGASGYLLKSTPLAEIGEAIKTLKAGGAPMSPQIARKVIDYFNPAVQSRTKSGLTSREKDIVNGLVDGLSYKMIAARLNISIETVRYHIKNVYEKLHVHSKAEVITRSLRGDL